MRRTSALLVAAFLLAPPLAVVPSSEAEAAPDLSLFNTGCKVGRSAINGCLITNATSPIAPGPLSGLGSKEGRACGWNILSLFAWGDLRITTAMADGGITEISSIDSSAFELIPGFYGINHYCTVVSGN